MPGALDGLRILELGQVVAGPHAGAVLAWFGAEVIKIEAPGGDPIRTWRERDATGTSLWWRTLNRDKQLIAVDLRTDEGREVVRRLVPTVDVVVENFRPGTLEAWGLGPDVLAELRPGLVIARVSGFGQTGPDARQPGYASVAEAVGGLRHLTGQPGGTSVRANLSLGDTVAGMQAVIGILAALRHRDRTGEGQVVDVAITESVIGLLEAVVPEHDRNRVVRGPSGSTITGVVPSNTYPCADGPVVIGANGDSLFRRLCEVIGSPNLPDDPRFATNPSRVSHAAAVDTAIAAWTSVRPRAEVVAELRAAAVPVGALQTVADLRRDPQLVARGVFETVEAPDGPLVVGPLGPRLAATPGHSRRAGGPLGADTDAVLAELGFDAATVTDLRRRGIVA